MSGKQATNKAKIARRVIEVLEYFDDTNTEATVMDIVRRYDRPQSSTSELLSSLVELGLLYKDPYSRAYSLTPRAALIGTSGQPATIRDGRMVRLLDRLLAQTGHSVVLTSFVGLDVQIVACLQGARALASTRNLNGGMKEAAIHSSAGWLMLSTFPKPRCEGMVRRLNAEADERDKFQLADMLARIDACRSQHYVVGPAGFGSKSMAFTVLVPNQPASSPMAISLLVGKDETFNPEALLRCVSASARACLPDEGVVLEALPFAA